MEGATSGKSPGSEENISERRTMESNDGGSPVQDMNERYGDNSEPQQSQQSGRVGDQQVYDEQER